MKLGKFTRFHGLCSQRRSLGSTSSHKQNLQNLIGSDAVISEELDQYIVDWTKHYKGGKMVCFPSTTKDVSNVFKYCFSNGLETVPQGGNTGLVGGGVGISQELIVSSRLLNRILSLDSVNGILVCESGCITERLMEFVSTRGFYLPIDLGSKGSCTIGGNVATNAGGMRVLRYGSWHHNVLGLEVVLADGTILDMLRTLKKDNCGYHLPHIFIGSEGTLGYITKVAIQLYPAPVASSTIFARVKSFQDISLVYKRAQSALGEVLSAFEIMDSYSLDLIHTINPKIISRFREHMSADPLSGYVLFEIQSGSNDSDVNFQRLESFLEPLLSSNTLSSAIISQDKSQETLMWSIRENVPITLAQCSKNCCLVGPFLLKYDISISLDTWLDAVDEVVTDLRDQGYNADYGGFSPSSFDESNDCYFHIYCFGHGGDQNLHLNILLSLPPNDAENSEYFHSLKLRCKNILDDAVLKAVLKRKGSMSAEHGIGQLKRHILSQIRSKEELAVMKMLKSSFDPKNILNPNKIL